jgi:nucleoside 2-deoxyribosyltransferase
MEHVSQAEAKGWRDYATANLGSSCKLLDPTRRIHNWDNKTFKRIFELDLRDIIESDIILVNLCDPKLAKHGTAMEVFYANYVLKKQVVAFKNDPAVKHPFFEQLVTEWAGDVQSACDIIKAHYL